MKELYNSIKRKVLRRTEIPQQIKNSKVKLILEYSYEYVQAIAEEKTRFLRRVEEKKQE